MTVGDVIAMLEEFPTDLPVYFCPDSAGFAEDHRVIAPLDAVMDDSIGGSMTAGDDGRVSLDGED